MSGLENLRGGHLHFDCVSGIAGDMSMGALMDLGVPAEVIRQAIAAVGLGDDRLRVAQVVKSGIAATNAWVHCEEAADELPAAHEDHEQRHDHYHYSAIRERIQTSSLSADVVELSLAIFDRLAAAEAKLHGTTIDEVAFHEVGAVDSIVDVIGTAAAVRWLAPTSVSAGPVAMGKGSIRCAHGVLPVPSPAALEILRAAQAPVTDGGLSAELCTPTGAAILATLVDQWGSMPPLTPIAIGYGAGDRDLPDRPNVLRVTLGKPLAHTQRGKGQGAGDDVGVIEIEANIDDMSAELCQYIGEQLFAAGALDVWWTAITMKKGRPAWTLQAIGEPSDSEALMSVFLKETSTIGLRYQHKLRRVLERELVTVTTEFGAITMKLARFSGQIVNAAPEFEVCRERAIAAGVPLKSVFAAAHAAWLATPKS